jgi:hypothetical protein
MVFLENNKSKKRDLNTKPTINTWKKSNIYWNFIPEKNFKINSIRTKWPESTKNFIIK